MQYIIIVSIPKHNLSNTCIYFKRTGKNALHPKLLVLGIAHVHTGKLLKLELPFR